MVLLYVNNKEILVLDNLSWKVLPLNKRKTLEFRYAFNSKSSYIIKNNSLVKEKKIKRVEVIKLNNILLEK